MPRLTDIGWLAWAFGAGMVTASIIAYNPIIVLVAMPILVASFCCFMAAKDEPHA